MDCNLNDIDDTLSPKPSYNPELVKVRRGESRVRKQSLKLILRYVFPDHGYELGFSLLFPSIIWISLFPVLG